MNSTLPTPSFYDSDNADDWAYSPDISKIQTAARSYKENNSVPPAAADDKSVELLLIDVQRDFCNREGTLYVAGQSGDGAIRDSQRIAEFIYRNLAGISQITMTLDTHVPFQIFSAPFWQGPDGEVLDPHTLIVEQNGTLVNTSLDGSVIHKGVRPKPSITETVIGTDNYSWLVQYTHHYVRKLAEGGKYDLYLWPPHCHIGSPGHTVTGLIKEAVEFHSHVRSVNFRPEVKGGNPLTENYSVLGPEVTTRHDGEPLAQKNVSFIQSLMDNDAVLIAGQAASHCVKSTIDDLLSEIVARDEALARKVYILEDCMSPVVVPGADFTEQTQKALQRYRDAGMSVVQSTDPVADWLDV
jgi:nicotinamidase-related amidase